MAQSPRRSPVLVAFAVSAAVVVAAGLALTFFGVGAELGRPRKVLVTVQATDVPPKVAEQIEVGDPIFTDPAGARIGTIVDVERGPVPRVLSDEAGGLHVADDPLVDRLEVVVETDGREGDGIISTGNQVVQAGQSFALISRVYYLSGLVVRVDVR